ncbi:MAG: response regulator [Gemmatimonadaceae bacterium]|jgi:two-component system phosphate regulon response regulator OmpR|nr:response regulator [Gemmatimonadaceae bacterium]
MQAPEVLIVDDDALLRRTVVRILANQRFRIREYDNPVALLEAALAGAPRPALVVTDVVMPGLSGFSLASALRFVWPGLPMLLFSGSHTLRDGHIDGDGPVRFLSKPFSRTDLLEAIEALLQGGSTAPPRAP